MKSFTRHLDEREYQLYIEAVRLHEYDQQLNEVLSAISGSLLYGLAKFAKSRGLELEFRRLIRR